MVALKENLGYANLASRSRISKDVSLMADRTSHMRYLESQLERMSAACNKVNSFDCRLEDMKGQVTMLQDKVVKLARMLDAHSHNVENTAAEIRDTATDVSEKQQVVHDLLFGGRSEKGISSDTLSDGCRKFLQAAYDKWASENKCQLTSQVQDVQTSIDNAVQNMFRDVAQASCTYQTKLTETKDHLTERVGDLEYRLDSVAASQLNLCTPVVDSMKKLQDETRQQMSMNKSAISHEIATLSQALEQHRLQSRAERCDSNATVQKLQEQTAQLAAAVHRLEHAHLNSTALHGDGGFMPSNGGCVSQNIQVQPGYSHVTQHERMQAMHTGAQGDQYVGSHEAPVHVTVPVSSDRDAMPQPGAPQAPGQHCETVNTAVLHALESTGCARSTRSAGTCISERQACHKEEVGNQSYLPHTQATTTPNTGGHVTNGTVYVPQPATADHQIGSTVPRSGRDQVFIMTPGQPAPPTTVEGPSGTATNLQHLQQQQGVLQQPTAQLVVLSSTGTIQPLNTGMWHQQFLSTPDAHVVPQPASTELSKELQNEEVPTQSVRSRRRPTSQQSTGRNKNNGDTGSEKDAQHTNNAQDSSTCPSPSSQRSCPTATNLPYHGSLLSAASLQHSTLWAISPVKDSDVIWKQPQHALNGSHSQPPHAMLPPRPTHKLAQPAQHGARQQSHAAQQRRNSSAAATTPRLSKMCDEDSAVDSSESDSDSCVDGDGLRSEASGCPSSAGGSLGRRHQKMKGKGTSTLKGTVRSKGKEGRNRTLGTGRKDDGHAAGINGHLSPLLDSSPASSLHQEPSEWSLPRQSISASSPRVCPACDVHDRGRASRRAKHQTVHKSTRQNKGSLRHQSSKKEGKTTSKRTSGCAVASFAPKLDGEKSGRQLAHQAYLAAVTGPFAMQNPHYAKPTKAALMRQACDSS